MNSRVDVLARVRGFLVGSLSGTVSIAAHGIAGGAMPPSQSSVMLLLAACAAVGVACAAIKIAGREPLFLIAALTSGQLIGHTALTLASDDTHGPGLSTPMIAAHICAIGVAAVLVRAAERAGLRALAALRRVVLLVSAPLPVDVGTWSTTPVHRSRLSLWLLVSAGTGTRGPPVLE